MAHLVLRCCTVNDRPEVAQGKRAIVDEKEKNNGNGHLSESDDVKADDDTPLIMVDGSDDWDGDTAEQVHRPRDARHDEQAHRLY